MDIKPLSEIAFNIITNIHDTLPEVDTKVGTFIRDVFIDPVSTEIAALYTQAKLVELAQSILTASGDDLDKLAKNYFIDRAGARPSSGKIRFYLGVNEPDHDVVISRGTVVSTVGKVTASAKNYSTVESVTIVAGNPSTYQKDIFTNQWYVDVDAVSQATGAAQNVDAGTITQIVSTLDSMITSVSNPFSFNGGVDKEDDASLILRMSLAISGSNIGTKDGYRSFILSQNSVNDAIVVGAGDPLMQRDGGEGGMVDIYVRAEQPDEDVFTFDVDYNYVTDNGTQKAYADIIPSSQPVISINDITGKYQDSSSSTGYTTKSYINGTNFKIEKGTNKYFQDVPWDTTFTDVPLVDSTGAPLVGNDLLKAQATNILNTKLKNFLAIKDSNGNIYYDLTLTDIKYDTDYSLIDPTQDSVLPANPDFFRGYGSDGLIYMIRSKNDPSNPYVDNSSNGRYFVQKDGKLFERTYQEPDFILVRDTSVLGNSIYAKDAIRWIPNINKTNLPRIGETLTITYTFNGIISELQTNIESKRVLTADVLMKSANKIPIEIKLEVVPNVGYGADTIRKNIISVLSSFVDEQTKMGGIIDRSDIVFLARGTDGVDAVNLDSVYLAVEDMAPIYQIKLNAHEYMELVNIYIKVAAVGSVV